MNDETENPITTPDPGRDTQTLVAEVQQRVAELRSEIDDLQKLGINVTPPPKPGAPAKLPPAWKSPQGLGGGTAIAGIAGAILVEHLGLPPETVYALLGVAGVGAGAAMTRPKPEEGSM